MQPLLCNHRFFHLVSQKNVLISMPDFWSQICGFELERCCPLEVQILRDSWKSSLAKLLYVMYRQICFLPFENGHLPGFPFFFYSGSCNGVKATWYCAKRFCSQTTGVRGWFPVFVSPNILENLLYTRVTICAGFLFLTLNGHDSTNIKVHAFEIY